MASQPLVSVALCTYNGARYLGEQLQSLFGQTHQELEIIAVDDGSTDGTVELLQEHARRDARLQVHVNPANLGFRRNFEKALSLCGGSLIAPCDQDDVWEPQKIAVLCSALGERAMAYCDSRLIDSEGRSLAVRVSDIRRLGPIDGAAPFALGNCVSGHAMLFRQSLLAGALPVPPEFFHDWWLAAVAAARGGVAYVDQCLVQYRQHDDSVTDISRARSGAAGTKAAGRRLQRSRDEALRMTTLAALPGPDQQLLQQLAQQWRRRETRWLTPRLFLLMLSHQQRLHQFDRQSSASLLPGTAKYLWGLKLKALVNRRAYSSTADPE